MAGFLLLLNFHRFTGSFQQRTFSGVSFVRKHLSYPFLLKSRLLPKCNNIYGHPTRVRSELLPSCFTPLRTQISTLSSQGVSTVQRLRQITLCSYSKQLGFQFSFSAQYSNSARPNEKRLKGLMIATYVSGALGMVLLIAVGLRFYGRFQNRARGIEELDVPHYPRRCRVLCRYRGYSLPTAIVNTVVNDVPWFEVRPDDVWVISYPKSGTTWLQEIVYLISTDLDFEKAKATQIDQRFPYFEYPFPGLKEISKLDSPRFIKTHLPFSLLPKQLDEKKPKVIYIARNPKDTVVSLYAFEELFNINKFLGTLEDYAQNFLEGLSLHGPWTKHVLEGWEQKNKDHVLFVTYEDLHRDFRSTVRVIARFLGKSLTDSQLEELEQHCSFSSMLNNNSVNYSWMKGIWKKGQFLRKGEVGDWKHHLSAETSAKFDAMTETLEPHGLQFVNS